MSSVSQVFEVLTEWLGIGKLAGTCLNLNIHNNNYSSHMHQVFADQLSYCRHYHKIFNKK